MDTNVRRESAKIYEFPRRPRGLADTYRRGDRLAAELSSVHAPTIEFGSGWYHQAAVEEAQRPGKP